MLIEPNVVHNRAVMSNCPLAVNLSAFLLRFLYCIANPSLLGFLVTRDRCCGVRGLIRYRFPGEPSSFQKRVPLKYLRACMYSGESSPNSFSTSPSDM